MAGVSVEKLVSLTRSLKALGNWSEELHPRVGAGQSGGGRFAPKGGGQVSGTSQGGQPTPPKNKGRSLQDRVAARQAKKPFTEHPVTAGYKPATGQVDYTPYMASQTAAIDKHFKPISEYEAGLRNIVDRNEANDEQRSMFGEILGRDRPKDAAEAAEYDDQVLWQYRDRPQLLRSYMEIHPDAKRKPQKLDKFGNVEGSPAAQHAAEHPEMYGKKPEKPKRFMPFQNEVEGADILPKKPGQVLGPKDFKKLLETDDRLFEGTSGGEITDGLRDKGYDDDDIQKFADWFLNEGIREGWLSAEMGMSNAKLKRGLQEGWLAPEFGFPARELPKRTVRGPNTKPSPINPHFTEEDIARADSTSRRKPRLTEEEKWPSD